MDKMWNISQYSQINKLWCLRMFCACIFMPSTVYSVRTDIFTAKEGFSNLDRNAYMYRGSITNFNDTLHMIIASKTVRPGQVYRVIVFLTGNKQPLFVRASLHRNGEQVSSATENVVAGITATLLMQVPSKAIPGNYRVKVEGNMGGRHGDAGKIFLREAKVDFSEKFLTILIQTNQLVYNLEQTMYIRIILLTTELKPFTDPVDVYLLDSRNFIIKRWVSVYPYLGFVNLEFDLPYDYPIGWWTIRVMALGQTEETRVLLERWFGHRFDINVATPTFILNTEESLEGSVMANYTNVATVTGNLTLRTFLKPLDKLRYSNIDWNERYIEEIVDLFRGTYDFSINMEELRRLALPVPLEKCEIEVRASVGERFQNFMVHAYGRTRVVSGKVRLRFLGSTPQIFKPGMPFKTRLAVSYDDLVPLEEEKLTSSYVRIEPVVTSGGERLIRLSQERLNFEHNGVVEIEIEPPKSAKRINIRAYYGDENDMGSTASASMDILAHHSRSNSFLQITTSTDEARAGEYAIFHVRSNFYLKFFSYIVLSKGIIVQSGTQNVLGMIQTMTTFSVPVSTEMAPVFHIVVYHVAHNAEVMSDSMTIPVHAINKRKFVLDVNMKQERSGNHIELVPRLTSETIVGISGFDSDHVSTHGRRELTPTSVVEAMYRFEKNHLKYQRVLWRDREGFPDKINYFTTGNYGRDTKETFQLSDLLAFTNHNVYSMPSQCNESLGLKECASGVCYFKEKECDGVRDCDDGTDEGSCFHLMFNEDDEELLNFYIYRRNRQGAFFDATAGNFAWKNKIIGDDQEEYVPTTAPKGPSAYALSAIAMSKVHGLHILNEPIIFDSTKPFFIIVEGPETAVIGEQIGLVVAILNFQFIEIKAEIILAASGDYRFVQVEPLGIVSSYKPRTSSGELQHLVYVKPVSHLFVHVPVVATRIGEIEVTIIGRTQVAEDIATHSVNIIPDGVTTHIHTSLLLDMRNEAYGIRYMDLNVTEDPIIPFQELYRRYIFGSPKASVSVIGDVVGAPLPTDFSPYLGLSALGTADAVKSGEHIMFDFAYVFYTLNYLRLTSQLKPDVQRQMLDYLSKAYAHQMVFYKNGAFSMFKGEQPSVWLTAYCIRIFHLAQYSDWENQLYIDTEVLTQSIAFILEHQTANGSFYDTTFYHWNRKMDPKAYDAYRDRTYPNVSLTAQVLLTITALSDLSGDMKVAVTNAKSMAVRYLERILPSLKSSYQVALVTYALLEADSVEGKTGFNKLDEMKRETSGMIYWSPEPIASGEILYQNQRPFILPRLPNKYDSLAIEATSYALLVNIRYNGFIQDQIVKWLCTMRVTDRAFTTSQDTVIALQALTEYSFRAHIRDIIGMKVAVESSANPGEINTVYIDNTNLAECQKVDILPNVWGHVEAVIQGSGMALLQVDIQYNVDKEFLLIQPPVPAFDLMVKGYYDGRNKSHMSVGSCARWTLTSESETSGLAVIEISLPTGYMIHKPDMDRYVHSKIVPRLQRGRVYPKSAVFMFDYLTTRWSCVNFTVQRWYPVANLTRFLKAKVYDYYTPERYKEIVYEDFDLYVLNICEVCGSYQCPYCPFFSFAVKPVISWAVILISVVVLNVANVFKS